MEHNKQCNAEFIKQLHLGFQDPNFGCYLYNHLDTNHFLITWALGGSAQIFIQGLLYQYKHHKVDLKSI